MRRGLLGAFKGLIIGGLGLATAACGSSSRIAGVAIGVSIASTAGAGGNVDLVRFPSVSPDGSQIVFSWRGDLWKVSSAGGDAVRLTANPASETRSAWSPDGAEIAFESTRSGYRNLHVMNADGTGVRQVTDSDTNARLTGYSADGSMLYFDGSRSGDVYRAARSYKVPAEGGDVSWLFDAFGSWPDESPDGNKIALTRGGFYTTRGGYSFDRRGYRGPDSHELWLLDKDANAYTQLTEWQGNDGMGKWADNNRLVYLSDRDFNTDNLFLMDTRKGEEAARRLTAFEGDDVENFDVSRNGNVCAFVAWDRLYTIDLTRKNARPVELTVNASEDESTRYELVDISSRAREAALSPDGKAMAVVAYGEIFVRGIEEDSPTRRITTGEANDREIAWSPDGTTLYFISDRGGNDSIYAATVTLTRDEIKEQFKEATEPKEEEPEEGAEADEQEADENGEDTDGAEADDDAESDDENSDGDKKDDKDDEKEDKIEQGERWADAVEFEITAVVDSEFNDRTPMPSPDGKHLAFFRTRGDILIKDLETGGVRTFIESWDFFGQMVWSPDSTMIALQMQDRDYNPDIWIAPFDASSKAVNVTKHPDVETSPRFSADGKVLYFISTRRGNQSDVYRVYLDPDLEALRSNDLDAYYEDAAKAAKKRKPLELAADDDDDKDGDEKDEEVEQADPAFTLEDLEDAWLRMDRITSKLGSEGNLAITPGGERIIFSSSDGGRGLYSVKWDGSDSKKLSDAASVQHVSLDGTKVVTVRSGQARTVMPEGGKEETVGINDTIKVDLEAQSSQKFREASRILGDTFYHPDMKGLDWAALSAKYHDRARRARTSDEFAHVAARFIGELNASHLGIYPPGEDIDVRQSVGHLGIRAERDGDAYVITKIITHSPASSGKMALMVGDRITGIELASFGARDTLDSLLKGRSGEETIVTIERDIEGESTALNVLITPTSRGAINTLLYREWWQRNAELVDEWSGGRVGYLHIRAMGTSALYDFERDLYASGNGKDGLLVDVRNNGGGSTADRVMAALMAQPHAYTVPRGGDASHTDGYPRDRLFIQRWSKPVNMLCNEKSFSNAEIVSHAFKTLGRGTLVGQETWGGVISTGGQALIDGTFVRMPFRGWFLLDGTDMENNGAIPDIIVEQTPEHEVENYDAQLRAAVEDILKRLD